MNRSYSRENHLPPETTKAGGISMRSGVFLMLLVGLLAASYDGLNSSAPTFAANPQAQTAEALSPSNPTVNPGSQNGQCQEIYQICMSNPQSDKQGCETNWKNCVTTKCEKKDTPTIDSCPKDSDCESSCTESATGQKGILSCCDPAPQHNNTCQKKIDGKCTKGFAAGASPLPNQITIGLPPPNQPLAPIPETFATPAPGSGQVGDAFNTRGAPIPYAQFSQDIAPVAASPDSGQTGGAPTFNDYQSPAAQALNKSLTDSAVPVSPGAPPAVSPENPSPSGSPSGDSSGKQGSTFAPPDKKAGNGGKVDANGNPPGGGTGDGKSGSGAGANSGLSSLLSGLMKGLAGALAAPQPPPAAPAQACSTDPNAYAQQQQQYQQQLQQYNYQLQQAQYQQQMQQYYAQQQGGYGYAPPPQQALPAQPTPCSPSTQQQCATQPQQPVGSCSGVWQPVRSGNCITNWQCSDLGAQLSCSPQTADVGMQLAITYSCAQGTATGTGFTASGQSGTATVTVAAPPAGTNTATYSLACSNGSVTSGAQCSVQVTHPSIVLVANPATISAGQTSQLGWVTSGMQACVISSPQDPTFTAQNASNTSVSGTAQTSALTAASNEFDLDCETVGGQTASASTTVTVPGGTVSTSTSSITATSTADGMTVNHGASVTINWVSSGEPSGAAVSLWVYDPHTGTANVLIAGARALSGSYQWTIPAADSVCQTDGSANVCGADLVAGHQYQIEVDVYTPGNAYVGDGPPPANPVNATYGDYSDATAFTVGQ